LIQAISHLVVLDLPGSDERVIGKSPGHGVQVPLEGLALHPLPRLFPLADVAEVLKAIFEGDLAMTLAAKKAKKVSDLAVSRQSCAFLNLTLFFWQFVFVLPDYMVSVCKWTNSCDFRAISSVDSGTLAIILSIVLTSL